jgi:hypothetical protein
VPVLLAVAWAFGWLLGRALRLAWWLLRALWGLTWRLAVLTAALLVVAFCRPLAWRLAVLGLGVTLSGRLRGGRWGSGGSRTTRTTDNAPVAPTVRLRPVSAQAVATASYAETRWFTRALDGPELLTMLVGPAGAGKSELVWATLRAQHDGEAFCGLATTRPRRVLLLSEMGGATLQPALRRWGFYAEPAGRLDAIRLRLVPPKGHVGALIDVLYAADIYRPVVVEGEPRQVEWPAVVEAVRGLVARGRYDRVIVDSLGEWMGSDNNDAMLRTLGACRQLTHAGAGVTILHHTPRSDPKRPRGGTVIEAKLDVGYSVTGTAAGGAPRSRTDPLRRLEWFKTRFPELTPADPLLLERVWAGPDSGERPRYQGAGGAPTEDAASADRRAGVDAEPAPPAALTGTAERVLAALRTAGPTGATMKALAEACGLPRQRVHEALTEALIPRSLARVGGFRDTPGGGPKASLYVAVGGPQSHTDGHRGHLRLVTPPPPLDAAGPACGGLGVGDPPTEPAVGGAPGGGT